MPKLFFFCITDVLFLFFFFFWLFYLQAVSGSLPSKIKKQQTSNPSVKSQMTEPLKILGT